MNTAPSSIVPPRPRFIVNDGQVLSAEFANLLQRWRNELNTIFVQESNVHATWPPENALDCFENYANRPKLAIELAQELSMIILELEASDGRFGDRELYAHQMGHLKWLVLSMLHDGTSYVIEGAPGTGKTTIEGFILMAATRLQMRGILKQSILCTTHRPFVLSQQALSRSERIARIRMSNRYESKKEWEYLCSLLEELPHDLTLQEWKNIHAMQRQKNKPTNHVSDIALVSEAPDGEDDVPMIEEQPINAIRHKLEVLLRMSKVTPEDKPLLQKVLSEAELLVSGQAAVVADIAEGSMLLPFPKVLDTETETGSTHGDLTIGMPAAFYQHGIVHTRREAGGPSREKKIEKGESPAVILTTDNAVFNTRGSVQMLLPDVGIFIVDEADAPATAYQEVVLGARGHDEKKNPPLTFLMSALKTTNGIGARPHANAYSPSIDILEGIDRRVLPDVGVHFFPPADEALYASDTQEALDQLVDMHFQEFDLPKTLEQHQPSECHSVIVTDAGSLDATVQRLREEYERRGLPGTVVPFRGNTAYPNSDRVLLWMMEEEFSADGKRMAKVLVSTPTLVVDALSLSGLENITIATAKGVGSETLERIFGRLQHSGLHRERGERYRGYFIQGLYKDTLPEATLLSFFGRNIDVGTADATDGFIERVPLQTLHSRSGNQLDVDTIRESTLMPVSYPLTSDALSQRKTVQGTKLQRVRPVSDEVHNLLYESQPVANVADVLNHTVWSSLESIASRAEKGWNTGNGNPESGWNKEDYHKAFFSIILEQVFVCLPAFMNDAKAHWKIQFEQAMDQAKDRGPMFCLEALMQRIKAAVDEANKTNRFSVPKNIIFVEADSISANGKEEKPLTINNEDDERNDDELDIVEAKKLTAALNVPTKRQKRDWLNSPVQS